MVEAVATVSGFVSNVVNALRLLHILHLEHDCCNMIYKKCRNFTAKTVKCRGHEC